MRLEGALRLKGLLCSPRTFKRYGMYHIENRRWYLSYETNGFTHEDIKDESWRVYSEDLLLLIIRTDRVIGVEREISMRNLLEILSEWSFLE